METETRTGTYILYFSSNGKEVALRIVSSEEDSCVLEAATPDYTDKSQIWIYYNNKKKFHSLLRHFTALEYTENDDQQSPILCDKTQERENQKFEVYNGYIRNQSLRKSLVYSPSDESDFVMSETIPECHIFKLIPVDISFMSIHAPPIELPFAIVFNVAAEEYALTLQMDDNLNGEGRRILASEFKPGEMSNQYWYFVPHKSNAIYSCAESNQVFDDMCNDDDGNNTVYTHRHHGRNNQQWSFSKRCIVGAARQKVITYIPSDPDFFKVHDKGDESGNQHYYIVPYFGQIPDIKSYEEVTGLSHSSYSHYRDGTASSDNHYSSDEGNNVSDDSDDSIDYQ